MRERTRLISTLIVILAVGTVSLLVWRERKDPTGSQPLSEMLGLSSPPSLFDAEISEWTPAIRKAVAAGDWERLARDLSRLQESRPEIYADQHLDYLHARALIETGAHGAATERLNRYLAPGHPFRVLALQHMERIAVEKGEQRQASGYRRALLREFPSSFWREGVVEREIESLGEDPKALIAFSRAFGGKLGDSERRDLDSRVVGALLTLERTEDAIEKGFALLRENEMDDAAERVWRFLDTPSLTDRYDSGQLHLLAKTAHSHRHFERAAEILDQIEPKLPEEGDEIRFAIGRAFFWEELFAEAEAAYLRGVSETADREEKAKFYYHSGRAAQLQGKDGEAETWFTRSIAVPGRFDATAASLTQRMRTRLAQKRWSDASHDVHLLRRLFARSESVVEASIGYAVAAVAAGDHRQALRTLGRIPRAATDEFDRAEIAYWRGRAFEPDDPLSALDEYLDVLLSDEEAHYAWFARARLREPAIAREVEVAVARRRSKIAAAIDQEDWGRARKLQTEIVAMLPGESAELDRLRSIYEQVEPYARVLRLEPREIPSLPLLIEPRSAGAAIAPTGNGRAEEVELDRGEILIALGLAEEAVDRIPALYPLDEMESALTQSLLHRRAGATKPSIYAIEVMMRSVPDDFVYELLPELVRDLLYPLHFDEMIRAESEEYGADPTLLRSIMREESRFDPRAKSFAAARGLLQFIRSTAREIGASIGVTGIRSGDLYEPEMIIRLGAKYVADLLGRFEGNRYRTAAAYNAGPNQAALWSRLASGEGDDYYYAAINFAETRHYVRRVLNSYRRYEQREAREGTRETGGASDVTDRADAHRPDERDERAGQAEDGDSASTPRGDQERADRAGP